MHKMARWGFSAWRTCNCELVSVGNSSHHLTILPLPGKPRRKFLFTNRRGLQAATGGMGRTRFAPTWEACQSPSWLGRARPERAEFPTFFFLFLSFFCILLSLPPGATKRCFWGGTGICVLLRLIPTFGISGICGPSPLLHAPLACANTIFCLGRKETKEERKISGVGFGLDGLWRTREGEGGASEERLNERSLRGSVKEKKR